jgi:hypothetical protein
MTQTDQPSGSSQMVRVDLPSTRIENDPASSTSRVAVQKSASFLPATHHADFRTKATLD